MKAAIELAGKDTGAGIGRGLTAFVRSARIGPEGRRSAPANAHGGELIDRLRHQVFEQLELVAPQILDRHVVFGRRVRVDAQVVRGFIEHLAPSGLTTRRGVTGCRAVTASFSWRSFADAKQVRAAPEEDVAAGHGGRRHERLVRQRVGGNDVERRSDPRHHDVAVFGREVQHPAGGNR
jgi:hypothetical protein